MIAEVMPSLSNTVVEIRKRMSTPVLVLGPAIGHPHSPVSSSVCHAAKQLDRSFTTKHHSPFLLDYPSIVVSSISPKMAGIPVPFADIAKPANDVSPESFACFSHLRPAS